jgi:hypothetical protein
MVNLIIKMIVKEIIEQEFKALQVQQVQQVPQEQLVHKEFRVYKALSVLMEHKVLQVSLTQNYVQQGQT